MSWWADKLNGNAPQQRAYAPPPQYVQPQQQPQYAPQYQQPQQPDGIMIAGGFVPMHKVVSGNTANGAARFERNTCPECGDPRYFNRDNPKLRKINLRTGESVAPAPLCEACGYNGMFEQFGSQPLQPDAPIAS
jgi:hypothetical protein